MGSFYSGSGWNKTHLGHCEDGIIYSGSGNGNPVGRYDNGSIYNKYKEYVGSYSGGSVYNSFREHIASYDSGVVYNQYLNSSAGKEQIGSYDGNPAEAAALALLFVNTSSGGGGGASATSSSGAILDIFLAIIAIIVKPFIWLYKVFEPIRYCFGFPLLTGYTWIIVPGIIFGIIGFDFGAIGIGFLCVLLLVISISYWIIVVSYKYKQKLEWRDVRKYYLKWFLIGPFAYREILKIANENDVRPGLTGFLSKFISVKK